MIRKIFCMTAAAAAVFVFASCNCCLSGTKSTLGQPIANTANDAGFAKVTTAALNNQWASRIKEKQAQVDKEAKDIKLLLIGDSITHFWENAGKSVMDSNFGKYHPLNLGFAGDRTQHTLWVLDKCDILNKIKPQLVTIMIGTNNFGAHEGGVEATAEGIRQIVLSVRRQLPDAKIVLYGIFPRGSMFSQEYRPEFKQEIDGVNAIISKFADNKNVFYEDLGPKFLNEKGELTREIMNDRLHPTAKGYEIWADSIRPYAEKYIK